MTAPVGPINVEGCIGHPTAFRLYPVTPTLSVAVGVYRTVSAATFSSTVTLSTDVKNRCFFIAVGQRQRDRAFGRIARGIGRNDREIVARLRLVIQAGRRIDLAPLPGRSRRRRNHQQPSGCRSRELASVAAARACRPAPRQSQRPPQQTHPQAQRSARLRRRLSPVPSDRLRGGVRSRRPSQLP